MFTAVDSGQGSVTPNCPNACSETAGSQVTVTANPASGWLFSGWSTQSGQSCSTNPCTFNMPNSQVTLKATFTQATQTLTTNVGSGSGTVTPNCPSGCSEAVASSISLTAAPASGWSFSGWSATGASCSGTSSTNPCALTMPNNPVTVSATFTQATQATQTLITGVDAGSGSISSNCANGCSEPVGSSVVVTATPSSGWQFSGWSTQTGISCSSNPCTFSMPNNAVTLRATFTQGQVTMTVSYSVVGGGSPSAPVFHYVLNGVTNSFTLSQTSKGVSVEPGTTWSVTPNPLVGSSSTQRWYSKQPSNGTASSTTLVLVFYRQTLQKLSYSVKGGGTGDSPTAFQGNQFGLPIPIVLTTTPTGYWFDYGSSWMATNPLAGSTSSERWFTTVTTTGTMGASTTRAFPYQHQFCPTMQVTPSGAGSTTPGSGWYNAGQKVSIKATAKAGFKFLSWAGVGVGSYSGTSGSATVTMNAPVNETASFGVIITITSNPTGSGYLTGNSTSVKTPLTFVWASGSTHNITAVSAVSCGTGCQYVFTGWSDGGNQSHIIIVPSSPTTYKASFQKQYLLTLNVNQQGAGLVAPSGGWYNAGQKVAVTATANTGHTFNSWKGTGSGSYTGTNTSPTVTMNSAITETANFT